MVELVLGEKIFNFLVEEKCIERVLESNCKSRKIDYIENKKYEFLFRDIM